MNDKSIVPATTVPSLDELRSSVNNVLLLQYMMMCYRTPLSYYLPLPPPDIKYTDIESEEEVAREKEKLLTLLRDAYLNMMFMLKDEYTTEREKALVESHAALVRLKKWLSDLKLEQIVSMPRPENMSHKNYVYMLKECNGYDTYNSQFYFFTSEADMEKFKAYKAK